MNNQIPSILNLTNTAGNADSTVGMEDSWRCCKCNNENYNDKWVCSACSHERCSKCKDLLG